MDFQLLAVAPPTTFDWSPKVGVLMVLCNILAIFIGSKIFKAGEGTQLPNPKYFGGLGLEALIATTSLGHVIGFGVILGFGAGGLL
jgi:photosystem I subunit 10|tara:strand:+ start:4237 stop:4494 length:258 start_codon:yes stop_codon:yes gene_type:complete